MAEEFIIGKGSITKKDSYVVVIGGSNIDISGSPDSICISRDSNPGTITFSPGGVGRNIAENLARMGAAVKLLSVVGNDPHGKLILQESCWAGIDINHVMIMESEPTSAYLSILDENKDMVSAVSDMSIINCLDKSYIEKNNDVISDSSLIIIDANLSEDVIRHITVKYKHKDIFIDTVSSIKAEKIIKFVGNFHTIKSNIIEAERLSGMPINTIDDMKKASMIILDKGVRNVFLTMGEKGILYTDRKQSVLYEKEPVEAINTTGAGDAFTAGLAYAYMEKSSVKKTLDFATAASELTVLHPGTINTNLSLENIIKQMKKRA